MSFDWLNYLDLASELYEQARSSAHGEANLRSSISRAYYAIYHQSCQILKQKWGIAVSKDADTHAHIRFEFRNKRQYSIAKKLNRMRVDRNKADYNDEFVNLEVIARENIWRAKQVLSDLHRL